MHTLPLKEYCSRTNLLDIKDIIKSTVDKEALIIYPEEELPVPSYIEIYKSDKKWYPGWHNFFRSILP